MMPHSMQSLQQPNSPIAAYATQPVSYAPLKAHYEKYNAIRIKLALLADSLHEDMELEHEANNQITKLLDEQALILGYALGTPIVSSSDAAIMMKFWDNEVVQGQAATDLPASDALVKTIFDFLHTQNSEQTG